MIAVQNNLVLDALADAFAAGGLLLLSEIQLFKSRLADKPQMVVADFVLSDFAGAVPIVTANWATATDADGRHYAYADTVSWPVTAATDLPQVASGFVLLSAAGDVIAYADFAAPLSILVNGQVVFCQPLISMDNGSSVADAWVN